MDDIYRQHILDHYKHPRNFGKLDKYSVSAQDSLVSCGDRLEMQLLLSQNHIQDVAFSGTGCAISIASASLLTQEIKGKTISKTKNTSTNTVLDLLGISLGPTRLKCALLSLEILHKALNRSKSLWHMK